MKTNQIELALAVFAGVIMDKQGYCGCPKCGSRELIHDGHAIDEGYISCMDCYFSINGSDPYEMVSRWNKIDRTGFQLEIEFE